MKKWLIKILFLTILVIVVPVVFGSVGAASLKFDKTTVTVSNGGTFQIAVTVDPAGANLSSVDVYATFDATVLKATAVTAGSLFPTVSNDITTSGKVYIAGMVNDAASFVSQSGTLATITFQGLKDGSVTLAFDCNASKIIKNDINATNVITCTQNGTAAITIGSGSSGTAPTTPPSNNNSSTNNPPAQLPQSGIFENVIKFAIPGAILLILGSILRLVI
ncbi:MAG: cohesin domain-containing protein [Patescibacteria group bacterium]|mgnify:FL=1